MELKRLEMRLQELERTRDRYRDEWQKIARYISPGRGVFDGNEPNYGQRDGDLLDATPFQALTTLAAGMQGGLTSPSRAWFKLGVTDIELADSTGVRVWLEEVERRMVHVMGQSNIYNCLHTLYGEVGAFGTGAIYIEEDPTDAIRCTALTAGEYAVAFNFRGLPTDFCRTFWMNAFQMAAEFGPDKLSQAAKSALEGDRQEQWFKVHHYICENDRHSPIERKDRPTDRARVASVYWQDGERDALRVSGYEEFPVLVPRWDVLGQDYYGRGPGWSALGESKMLQELRFDYLAAQKMAIHPPVMGPVELRKARPDLVPGGVTYYAGDAGFRPIYQVQPDIPGQLNAIAASQEAIRRFFYADLFLMLAANSTSGMTAREVAERHEEKMLMLGPVLERLENELLDPLIARVFAIMDRQGLIPEPPEELAGRTLQVEYVSVLAQAQRMAGLDGIERLTGFVTGLAPLSPEVMDKMNFDEAIDQYAKKLGVPGSVVNSEDAVAGLREQRAAQQQQQQQLMEAQQMGGMAQQGAATVNQLAQASASGGLDVLAQAMGQTGAEAGGDGM